MNLRLIQDTFFKHFNPFLAQYLHAFKNYQNPLLTHSLPR